MSRPDHAAVRAAVALRGPAGGVADAYPLAKLLAPEITKDNRGIRFGKLAAAQQGTLWNGLEALVSDALRALHITAEEDAAEQADKENVCGTAADPENFTADSLIRVAIALISAALQAEGVVLGGDLLRVLQRLHDVLLGIPDEQFSWKIRDKIAALCETWHTAGHEGRELLSPQTITYLLMRSLVSGAKAADVKHVHRMREALLSLDFADQSCDSLKELMLYAFSSPLYMKTAEGRKLLVYFFGLHPPFIKSIHAGIKNQIPRASKSHLVVYGEIYFKAWKCASATHLVAIEYDCIQDLMHHAALAQWRPLADNSSTSSMAARLRKVLEQIHKQKKFRGVDEMLYRLWEPIIWRSLRAANPVVRRNASTLFIDAFPLESPNAHAAERDENLQEQIDRLDEILKDPCPHVRVVGVEGVCRIFAIYWEVIPAKVLSDFVNYILGEMAYDSSSSAVRVAVCQGMTYLLQNMVLSSAMLKPKLPALSRLLHDTAEKVRLAFLDMLIAINGIKDLKFYEVVDIGNILARLAQDSPNVCKRITVLLVGSFLSPKKSVAVQIERCRSLLQLNRRAARVYYFYACRAVPLEVVAKFIIGLYELLKLDVAPDELVTEPPRLKRKRGKQRTGEGKNKADMADMDRALMVKPNIDEFWEVIAILLNGCSVALKKAPDIQREVFATLSTIPLERHLNECSTAAGRSAVYAVGQHLPEDARGCLEGTPEFVDTAAVRLSDPRQLKRVAREVLALLLASPLGAEEPANGSRRKEKRRKGSRTAVVRADDHAAGLKAMSYLNVALVDSSVRAPFVALSDSPAIARMLAKSVVMFETLSSERAGSADDTQFLDLDLAVTSFRMVLRICVHANAAGLEGFDLRWLRSALDIVNDEFVDRVRQEAASSKSNPDASRPRRASRKRKAKVRADAGDQENGPALKRVLEVILEANVELLMLGFDEPCHVQALGECIKRVLETGGDPIVSLIPLLGKYGAQLARLAQLCPGDYETQRGKQLSVGDEGLPGGRRALGSFCRQAVVPYLGELLNFVYRNVPETKQAEALSSLRSFLARVARLLQKRCDVCWDVSPLVSLYLECSLSLNQGGETTAGVTADDDDGDVPPPPPVVKAVIRILSGAAPSVRQEFRKAIAEAGTQAAAPDAVENDDGHVAAGGGTEGEQRSGELHRRVPGDFSPWN